MPLANSNGPLWIRAQHAEAEKRRAGLGPVRDFLARLLRGEFRRATPRAGERDR